VTVLNHLSLFSGYEGFGLGLKLAGVPIKTVGYVEIDEYCQRLLQARIRDGYLDWAPIIRDIRAADFRPMAGLVDIVTAGFPCQPHSFAGKRKGAADERNLWPDTLRVIREVGPGWALLENVPGILANGYAGTVVGQLSEIRYDCLWHCVPAAAVGAPHLRWRWWCLAYPTSDGNRQLIQECQHQAVGRGQLFVSNGKDGAVADSNGGRAHPEPECQPQCGGEANPGRDGKVRTLADASTEGLQIVQGRPEAAQFSGSGAADCGGWWDVEPDVGRVANGVASRVDRLKALGNGIVPAVVAKFLRGIG
jgi:DNA (cytosine-5)-methyltransferase 1